MFMVIVNTTGVDYFLRSTIWTSEVTRADPFDTREKAQAALDRAKKFMKAKTYKAARIVETGRI